MQLECSLSFPAEKINCCNGINRFQETHGAAPIKRKGSARARHLRDRRQHQRRYLRPELFSSAHSLSFFLFFTRQAQTVDQFKQTDLLRLDDVLSSLLHEQRKLLHFSSGKPSAPVTGDLNFFNASVALENRHNQLAVPGKLSLVLISESPDTLGFIPASDLDAKVVQPVAVLHPAQDTKPHFFLAEIECTPFFPPSMGKATPKTQR